MNWKFWQKKPAMASGGGRTLSPKLPGPKDLPQQVGRELVVVRNADPDYVWGLKCVSRPREDSKTRRDIRIYDPEKTASAGVRVRDYTSLDDQPSLVLFEGWYEKGSNAVSLQADG